MTYKRLLAQSPCIDTAKPLPFTHKWASRKRQLFVITEQTNFDEHEKSKHFWGQAS